MDKKRWAYVCWGAALAVVGVCAALVAWVGLDRANQYLGVPAAIAALVGLVLAGYGLAAGSGGEGVDQLVQDSEIHGDNTMTGSAGGSDGPRVAQSLVRSKVSGDNEMVGRRETDPGSQESA